MKKLLAFLISTALLLTACSTTASSAETAVITSSDAEHLIGLSITGIA